MLSHLEAEQGGANGKGKGKGKGGIVLEGKIRILTETKEDEKKESSDEHGPELYASVEEREGPSES
jgi:hypothetical protein